MPTNKVVTQQSIDAYNDYIASSKSLTERENVYKSLLELGTGSARMLSDHSGVRINHLSNILLTLRNKGLIQRLEKRGWCTSGFRFVYFFRVSLTKHLPNVEVKDVYKKDS